MLSAKEAFRKTQELVNRKEDTLMDVLRRCNTWIEKHVKRKHTSCVYKVPEFLLGVPLYNVNTCITFIQQRLTDQGFCVMYLFPRYLVISWDLPVIAALPKSVIRRISPAVEAPRPPLLTDGVDVRGPPSVVADPSAKPRVTVVREEDALKSLFIRSISDLKPSGRLVLDLR